jgi:hypothetical protein
LNQALRETIGVPDSAALEVAPGIRVAWDDLDQTRADLAAGEPSASWRLEGQLGAGHSALRVLTGLAGKGTLLLLAAARPDEADGHDAENPIAVLISRSGEAKALDEALMSMQYSASGRIERLGLELYAEGDDYPVRGAGDARRASASDEGALRHEQAWLDFRLDGEAGDAILDILHV